ITLYDIHSTLPEKAWSSLSWNVRYILNYKKLPYKSEYVEYPDIEETCKKLGIPPTSAKPDGSPFYTLPAIFDSDTGMAVADSFAIAQYLDFTYPETPTVVLQGTEELTLTSVDTFVGKFCPLYMCLIRRMCAIFTPRTTEYLSRKPYFGKSWAELMMFTDEDEMKCLKIVEGAMLEVHGKCKKTRMNALYVMADQPTFVDFTTAGMFVFIRTLVGEDSEMWEEILNWHGGHWGRLLEELKEWEVI
ncbi:hypothetical protein BDQ17DRAFT_1186057, partial [Cyathus striatus]